MCLKKAWNVFALFRIIFIFWKCFFLKALPFQLDLANSLNCAILNSWLCDNFIVTDELFAKALQSLKICPSFNNNIYGKLLSLLESQITFDERVTSILFTKVVNYTIVHLNCYIEWFYFNTTSNQNKFTILPQFLAKNPE